MSEELEKDIKLNREVIDSMPVNNKKNRLKTKTEIDNSISSYLEKQKEILNELDKRLEPYLNISKSEYKELNDSMNSLSKALIYTNNLSSPYEKLKIDKLVYQLINNLDGSLENTNKCLLKIIKVFSIAGIDLKSSDFNYTKFVNSYMKVFYQDINSLDNVKLKQTFDNLYWKSPLLILELELNIRYLYLKNKDKFVKYISSLNKELLSKFKNKETSIINDYAYLKRKLDTLEFNDKNNLIYDFVNNKLNIEDYQDDKIDSIMSGLFNKKEDGNIEVVLKLYKSLREYQSYLEYLPLIEEIKNLYEKTVEKNFVRDRLKKISKLESKLSKVNRKAVSSNKKTKINDYELEINKLVEEINLLYKEIDDNIFNVVVKENLEDNSTVFKALLLACQYYSFLVKYFKNQDNMLTYKEIDKKIDILYKFVLDPDNNIINNITIKEDKDILNIIIENYRLFDVKIDEDMLKKENLDSFINNLEKVIISNRLKLLNIDFKQLLDIKKTKELKEKIN